MMKQILKRISAYFQSPAASFHRHNSEYSSEGKLELEKEMAAKHLAEGTFRNEENKIQQLLEKHPEVRNTAVDIGSGAGWLSAWLATYFKQVYGLEPSAKAVEIAKILYPPKIYPNIDWRVGFAEELLPQLKLNSPALFVTGVVLSHLRDKEVRKICDEVSKLAAVGSLLSFSECWGEESHQLMWHVRSQEWWRKSLPGWELDFHGPVIQNLPGRHKGIHGLKIG